jgi:hypothetical protein
MFLSFFLFVKRAGIPVGLKDLINLLEALDKQVVEYRVDDFYYLCRTVWIKDEQHLDLFDQLFGIFFRDAEHVPFSLDQPIPEEWLKKGTGRMLSEEDKAKLKSLGGLDELVNRLKELLEQQKKRHEGGSKWIGTGGTSPFGAYGYNPEGFRIGQEGTGAKRAIKVWDKREFKNLSSDHDLETRNIKMALRSLRHLTREGPLDELDIKGTIDRTTRNAGMLDLSMVPSRRNNVKVLLFFDVGGSMDEHVLSCERLFSAAKYEFKHLEYFYFHNCIYEFVWKDNTRRRSEKISTYDLIHTYNSDYKVIVVGDAAMSPIELTYKGGSVEHWNEEPGITWLGRLKSHFTQMIWLNPTHFEYWRYTSSISYLQEFFNFRMFPLTMNGLTLAMKGLKNQKITFGQDS